jgi:hypothetical protein
MNRGEIGYNVEIERNPRASVQCCGNTTDNYKVNVMVVKAVQNLKIVDRHGIVA